jgi:tripartite-type tricarboxylate transporter receptor subunit TctC
MLGTNHIAQAENARALAVAGEEPFEGLPDAPTFADSGYDVTIEFSWGVGMPAGVPDEVATAFGEAVIAAMDTDEVRDQVGADGLDPILIGPDEAQAYVDDQIEIYAELAPILEEMHG